jgi:DNA (cytosine-5)-methyltransferase 1
LLEWILCKRVPIEILESVINAPIGDENNKEIQKQIDKCLGNRKVDLIIGGPPCQAYSLVGRSRSKTKMEGDPRNYLFIQYAEYLEKYKPKMFVFENVLGLKSAKGGHYLNEMERVFNKNGYQIKLHTLEAKNCVPLLPKTLYSYLRKTLQFYLPVRGLSSFCCLRRIN